MAGRRGTESQKSVASGVLTSTTTLAPAGSRGRVFAMTITCGTLLGTWTVSSGGVTIWQMRVPAAGGTARSVNFPHGLSFTDGLIATETAGDGNFSIAFVIDEGAGV